MLQLGKFHHWPQWNEKRQTGQEWAEISSDNKAEGIKNIITLLKVIT